LTHRGQDFVREFDLLPARREAVPGKDVGEYLPLKLRKALRRVHFGHDNSPIRAGGTMMDTGINNPVSTVLPPAAVIFIFWLAFEFLQNAPYLTSQPGCRGNAKPGIAPRIEAPRALSQARRRFSRSPS
jgi:hypothetical protein